MVRRCHVRSCHGGNSMGFWPLVVTIAILTMAAQTTLSTSSSSFTVLAFSTPLPSFSTTTTTTTTRLSTRSSTILFLSNHHHDDHDEESMISRAKNDARTDVRNLLTQRAIQSFLYLLESCRDPHSGKWIEDFLNGNDETTGGLLNYHGTGAEFMTNERFSSCSSSSQQTSSSSSSSYSSVWDGPLLSMMVQDKDVVIVSAKRRGRGHGGWSKNNPYLEDRYVEFRIDIDPISLTNRILAVREQIAKEWISDLDIITTANNQILTSYFSQLKTTRDTTPSTSSTTNIDGSAGSASAIPPDDEEPIIFERTLATILNNQTSFMSGASSPFRKGNLDLLYNLCTQDSIHRLLRSMKEEENNNNDRITRTKEQQHQNRISFEWLRDFYAERVSDYFDGDVAYGRADDFLQALLQCSPSVISIDHGQVVGLADPLGLAEQIIEIRNTVVEEWKQLMIHVPDDHASGIRLALLERQMVAWGSGGLLGGSGGQSIVEDGDGDGNGTGGGSFE